MAGVAEGAWRVVRPHIDSYWVSGFRALADQLLPHIVALLPRCVSSLGSNPHEDCITRNLVSGLSASATVREIAVVEYQFEPFRVDARGNCVSTGRIDFVAHSGSIAGPPRIPLRETYVAYECKRLNVQTKTGMRYLAPEYVDDGVVRFVRGQYSESLPFGCMLGYVIDGDVAAADKRVRASLRSKKSATGMFKCPAALSAERVYIQFETHHHRSSSGACIELRHILVSCAEPTRDSSVN